MWDNIREEEIRELEGLFRQIYRSGGARLFYRVEMMHTKPEELAMLRESGILVSLLLVYGDNPRSTVTLAPHDATNRYFF